MEEVLIISIRITMGVLAVVVLISAVRRGFCVLLSLRLFISLLEAVVEVAGITLVQLEGLVVVLPEAIRLIVVVVQVDHKVRRARVTRGSSNTGGFGYGGAGTTMGSGGGGGWYGGGGSNSWGGGGGSGYIGGVTGGSMQNGQRSGHGYATITFVS